MIQIIVSLAISSAYAANVFKFGPIVRDSNGLIQELEYADASGYCDKTGGRLPTVREAAMELTNQGAKGIKETNQYPNQQAAKIDGYVLIFSKNGEKEDSFYFNNSGYKCEICNSSGTYNGLWQWTMSTLGSSESSWAYRESDGALGRGGNAHQTAYAAFRCVMSRR